MSNISFRIKKDKAKLWKQHVTVTSIAVVTTMFLFGMCNCMVDSDVGKGDLLPMLGILHICQQMHMRYKCLQAWTACSLLKQKVADNRGSKTHLGQSYLLWYNELITTHNLQLNIE